MILEVKNGYFGYTKDNTILKNISFTLGEKEIMTILGQNGSGKTTILKCVIGILKWQQGYMVIDRKPLALLQKSREQFNIGYVPQAHNLTFPYTVREVVTMGRARHIGLFSVPSKRDRLFVDQAMEEVGIGYMRDDLCTQLSGGQLQLVYIARALAGEPKVLILDEPESHLDFRNQLMILNLIKKLIKERNISCIINTHNPENALRISDTTLLLGRDSYMFGKTGDIITEENVRDYFNISVKILPVPYMNEEIKAFVVLDSLDSQQDVCSCS